MDLNNAARRLCIIVMLFMALLMLAVSVNVASADSAVSIIAHSDGNGHFSFEGNGARMHANIEVDGFDEANVNMTNAWSYGARITYRDVGSGNIMLSATRDYPYDPMYYYVWKTLEFKGDGEYVPPGGGGRSANLTNSPNVTGTIEYPQADHKACFLFDGRHTRADVRVLVHNGHNLENATVTMYFTDPVVVKQTNENGFANFYLSPGKYHMTVEADGFDSMIVDDLQFSAENMYQLIVNMTNCTCSAGVPVCGPSVDDLLLYYKKKGPGFNPISPQNYTNYYAQKLTKCRARDNPEADGTLERMADKWGIYPSPPINVLLYSCNMTKVSCKQPDYCLWNVSFTVKNYQKYPCNYTVSLIIGNMSIEMQSGMLGKTSSSTARMSFHKGAMITASEKATGKMYLAVVSARVI